MIHKSAHYYCEGPDAEIHETLIVRLYGISTYAAFPSLSEHDHQNHNESSSRKWTKLGNPGSAASKIDGSLGSLVETVLFP